MSTPSIEEFERAEEKQIQLGEYLTGSVRQEIQRTQGTATCLLTVLSFVGTAASAGLAGSARQRGSVWALIPLVPAGVLLLAALMLILWALRPRLPKSDEDGTGWPVARFMSPARFEVEADNFAEFLRQDAVTLAEIAFKKFALIRRAYSLTMLGLPLLLIGVGIWFLLG